MVQYRRMPNRIQWLVRWISEHVNIVMIALLLMTGLSLGFVKLADEVLEGETQHFDNWVLQSLRVSGNTDQPRGPVWVEQAAMDITALGGPTVLGRGTLALVG